MELLITRGSNPRIRYPGTFYSPISPEIGKVNPGLCAHEKYVVFKIHLSFIYFLAVFHVLKHCIANKTKHVL